MYFDSIHHTIAFAGNAVPQGRGINLFSSINLLLQTAFHKRQTGIAISRALIAISAMGVVVSAVLIVISAMGVVVSAVPIVISAMRVVVSAVPIAISAMGIVVSAVPIVVSAMAVNFQKIQISHI